MSKQTARLEAFSDGVFAIALTLLVLELKVPAETVLDGSLRHALAEEWPAFLSFTLSFVTILIGWTNHHANLVHVEKVDGRLLFANGALLFWVTFLPFPTAVLGTHLAGEDAKMAAQLYSGAFVALNLTWILFWRAARRPDVNPGLPHGERTAVDGALMVGFAAYLAAFALAFWSAAASIGLCMLLAVFWTVQALRHHEHHDAA